MPPEDDHKHDHDGRGHGHGHTPPPPSPGGKPGFSLSRIFGRVSGFVRENKNPVLMTALLGTTALASPLITTTLGAGALLAGSLWLLLKSSDVALNSAEASAKKMGLSPLMLGLAMGALTSIPELSVAIQSVLSGSREIGIGNIVGGNVAHVFLIMGITAALARIARGKGLGWKFNTYAMAGATVGFGSLLAFNLLSPPAGIAMLGLGGAYVGANYLIAKKDATALGVPVEKLIHNHDHGDSHGHHEHAGAKSVLKNAALGVGGLGALIYAADMIVKSASKVALDVGVNEAVIGALAVGIGTSLPELTVNIRAALKKNTDMAVGNILGCNIFGILMVGGAMALAGVPVPEAFSTKSALGVFNLAALGTSAGLMTATLLSGKGAIKKWQGYAALGLYAAYVAGTIALGGHNAATAPSKVTNIPTFQKTLPTRTLA